MFEHMYNIDIVAPWCMKENHDGPKRMRNLMKLRTGKQRRFKPKQVSAFEMFDYTGRAYIYMPDMTTTICILRITIGTH